MHDSVCATAKAVAARRICSFSSGAACAVHLQTHEQEAYWKNIGNTTCTSCEFLWYCMHLYAIPHHSSVELVIPACSSRIRISFMFSELLVACFAWSKKRGAELLRMSETIGYHTLSFVYLWLPQRLPWSPVKDHTQRGSFGNVWKMYRNGLTSNHLFGLFMPEASAGCYFGSCHGAKIEPHRCPSSWIQSYMSYMGRFQMPRKQVLSFSFQRDPRKARTVRNVTSAHSGTLLYV